MKPSPFYVVVKVTYPRDPYMVPSVLFTVQQKQMDSLLLLLLLLLFIKMQAVPRWPMESWTCEQFKYEMATEGHKILLRKSVLKKQGTLMKPNGPRKYSYIHSKTTQYILREGCTPYLSIIHQKGPDIVQAA